MRINASKYEPKDVIKIVREWTNLTQKDFGKLINKSNEWVKANESGKTNFYFKDLLQIAKLNNIDIIITKDEHLKKRRFLHSFKLTQYFLSFLIFL